MEASQLTTKSKKGLVLSGSTRQNTMKKEKWRSTKQDLHPKGTHNNMA